MNLFEPVRIGLSQIWANKLRSMLSLTGILIAVGSVIGVLSLGDGLRGAIVGEFDKIGGTSTIFSWGPNTWYRDAKGRWVKHDWEEYLTWRDVEAILAATDKVEIITPTIWVGGGTGISSTGPPRSPARSSAPFRNTCSRRTGNWPKEGS